MLKYVTLGRDLDKTQHAVSVQHVLVLYLRAACHQQHLRLRASKTEGQHISLHLWNSLAGTIRASKGVAATLR